MRRTLLIAAGVLALCVAVGVAVAIEKDPAEADTATKVGPVTLPVKVGRPDEPGLTVNDDGWVIFKLHEPMYNQRLRRVKGKHDADGECIFGSGSGAVIEPDDSHTYVSEQIANNQRICESIELSGTAEP